MAEHTPSTMHDALSNSKPDREYAAYSCNGINLFGDKKSIDAVMAAFHKADQVELFRAELIRLRGQITDLRLALSEMSGIK